VLWPACGRPVQGAAAASCREAEKTERLRRPAGARTWCALFFPRVTASHGSPPRPASTCAASVAYIINQLRCLYFFFGTVDCFFPTLSRAFRNVPQPVRQSLWGWHSRRHTHIHTHRARTLQTGREGCMPVCSRMRLFSNNSQCTDCMPEGTRTRLLVQ
jgi:hypothetical protein